MLKDGERLDDLQYKGLMLIQQADAYCFTSDAVLLANTARVGAKDKVADLGAGSGIISVLIAAKRGASVTAVEFQDWAAELIRRNAELNKLSDKITVYEGDIKGCREELPVFDVVVTNPPYFKAGSGEMRGDRRSALSRHESSCTLEDIAKEASCLLREGGKLYMVHKTERMAEVIFRLAQNRLETKEITLIYPKADKEADTFIVGAVKGGRAGMKLHKLIVYDEKGNMTEEAARLYGK